MHFRIQEILVVVVLLGSMSGCSRAKPAAPEPAPVDPRFATAEALLTYFNSLNTQLPPNFPEMAPLYYAENEFQRKQLDILHARVSGPDYRIDKAMYDQFGEPMADWAKFHHAPPKKCTAAKVERTLDRRVESSYKNERGKQVPLQLVQIGDRWWVSGYSIEFQFSEEQKELMEEFSDGIAESMTKVDFSFLEPMIADIRAGMYKTAADARAAHLKLIMDYLKQRSRRP